MDGLQFVPVPGTRGTPYLFGAGEDRVPIEIGDFRIATTPVTQALWIRVMGTTRTPKAQMQHPVTHVSWHDVTGPGGFLERLNAVEPDADGHRFRLPSESEWEYAARGGPHWRDGYRFSGGNDINAVAWYGPRWTAAHRLGERLLGPRLGWKILGRYAGRYRPTHTHDVATKAPNQLGIYDMSGNVWEWCQDVCTDNLDAIPRDGSPCAGAGEERRLRGGCHDNWDLHCTVWWRYGIAPEFQDGCIGFRLALSAP